MEQPKHKALLIILDGFGEGKDYEGNAITRAKTPNIDRLRSDYPFSLLKCHGNAVGLPEKTQGGSEVGHFTMGAGRIVYQSLETINHSIKDKTFFEKKPLLDACEYVKKTPKAALQQERPLGALHLLGMISDQGVHATIEHLYTLLKLAKDQGITKTYIHAITDGRDVPERSAQTYIKALQEKIAELGMGKGSTTEAVIATICGRYFAMDRDNNWDRTEQAYNLIVSGKGIHEEDPIEAIKNAYSRGVKTDYYMDPIIIDEYAEHATIRDKDAVIFFNFRTDRTRQLTYSFTREEEIGFTPEKTVNPFFICMGNYSKKAPVVFGTQVVPNNLGKVISDNGLHQLRIGETEKYAHVTYFFNNQIQEPFANEDRILIDSKKAPSYAQVPEMSAHEITERLIKEMESGKYEVIVVNFANGDLVGHSGDFTASVKAVEVLDECIGKITTAGLKENYDTLITGDHGNVEYMIYDEGAEKGQPCPSHTRNPVPLFLISNTYKTSKLNNGELKDVATTLLALLEIPKPAEMTGENLITPHA